MRRPRIGNKVVLPLTVMQLNVLRAARAGTIRVEMRRRSHQFLSYIVYMCEEVDASKETKAMKYRGYIRYTRDFTAPSSKIWGVALTAMGLLRLNIEEAEGHD